MSNLYLNGLRCIAYCLGCLAAHNAFAQTNEDSLLQSDVAVVQRLLQYELVLDSPINSKVGLCVDELMGKTWFLSADPASEVRQSVVDKVRQAEESCAVANSGKKSRLAAEIRAMTERQLKLALRLEKAVANARICVSTSPTTTELNNCITTVQGTPTLAIDFDYWLRLYEHRIFQ